MQLFFNFILQIKIHLRGVSTKLQWYCTRYFLADCSEPVDLALLVDGSGSIDPIRQFPKVRKFLKELAAAFQIGPTKTKVALVQFSGRVSQKVEFGLDQYKDLQGVIGGVDSMEQLR